MVQYVNRDGLVRARHPGQPARLLRLDAAQDAPLIRRLPRLVGSRRGTVPPHAGQFHRNNAAHLLCVGRIACTQWCIHVPVSYTHLTLPTNREV